MKKLLSLFLAFIMVISILFIVPFTSFAKETDVVNISATSGDYMYRVLSDDTAEITVYTGYVTKVSIPSKLGGYKVTSIGEDAFSVRESLTSVTIPDSVTSIGDCAFSECYSLTSITIPDSVTSIGDGVLSGCESLTYIKVDSNNKYYDSRDNCNAIIETSTNTLIYGCQNTVIPNGVTGIYDGAFSWCSGLTSITIPDSVTSIGEYAFVGCYSLISITIPDSVTSIGDEAFCYCESLTSITIPDSVTSIGNSAFSSCYSLESISIYSINCGFGKKSIPSSTKIYCYENSTAHEYALNNGNEYDYITDVTAMLGDVDGDGEISVMDATAIQLHVAKIKNLTIDEQSVADTDKDGEISVMDATQIQMFVAKLIPEL